MIELGTKVRKIREFKDLTQNYMAEKLNMSRSMYQKYESNDSKITPTLLEEIAEVLEISPEHIENFDERTMFSNGGNTNTANDQGKANLIIGNYFPTVNQYMFDEGLEELYKKNIKLLEEKIQGLEKELDKD